MALPRGADRPIFFAEDAGWTWVKPVVSTRFNASEGGFPERSKGSDCKSDGIAFEGSNPSPPTDFVGSEFSY
jgi:hypothetical protein